MRSTLRKLIRWILWGPVVWNPLTTPTPKGQKIYASDGDHVWDMNGSGLPVPEYFRAKAWAVHREPYPAPPKFLSTKP